MRVASRFYVLDYDRCLGNTERLYSLLLESVTSVASDFDIAAMDAERQAAEVSGSSFDGLRYIKQRLGDDQRFRAALRAFIARGQSQPPDALLEEGARDFIDYLVPLYPFGILTFGSPVWQHAKLEACSLHTAPHSIMNHKYKIKHMKDWRDDRTGLFVLPEEFSAPTGYSHAKELILVDDKATAFADIEQGMRGYWLLHHWPLPSQAGEVDDALVSEVTSFQQVIDLEAAIDKT